MGTTTQRTPVSWTTSAWSRNLGSAELIAVSVTIVLIASRLMIRRSGPGRCQAPRTSRPGTTICTRFSNQMSRLKTSKIAEPRPKASTKLRSGRARTDASLAEPFSGSQDSRSADTISVRPDPRRFGRPASARRQLGDPSPDAPGQPAEPGGPNCSHPVHSGNPNTLGAVISVGNRARRPSHQNLKCPPHEARSPDRWNRLTNLSSRRGSRSGGP